MTVPHLSEAYEDHARRHPTKAARQLVRIEANPDFDHFYATPRGGAMVDGLRAGLDGAVRCRRCGRRLLTDESKARRIGPECLRKAA